MPIVSAEILKTSMLQTFKNQQKKAFNKKQGRQKPKSCQKDFGKIKGQHPRARKQKLPRSIPIIHQMECIKNIMQQQKEQPKAHERQI